MANEITISDGTTTIELPKDLVWSDELTTTQIAQDTKRTLTGKLVVFEDTRIEGRPFTLGGDKNSGWMVRSDVVLLRQMTEVEDLNLTLVIHGTTYTVRFDRKSSPIEASAVIDCSNPSPEHKYSITLHMFTVTA